METSIAGGMCRCCASEGAFKDIKSCYTWMGEEEVYADMLKECFDVHLSISSTGQYGGICEVCVTQLRNAANFKKQVLQTEEQFQKFEGKFFSSNIVKIENQADDTTQDNDSDDNQNDSIEDNYSATEYEVPIKSEVSDEKPRKRAKGTAARAAKKAKIDQPDTSVKRVKRLIKIEIDTTKAPRKTGSKLKCITLSKPRIEWIKKKSTKEPEKKKVIIKIPSEKKRRSLRFGAADKHHANIREILDCSNATPIRCHSGIGYACCFCELQFVNPSDLKKHTTDTHQNVNEANFFKNRRMDQYIVRLDITALFCKLCRQSIDSLEQLIDHLRNEHSRILYSDIKNQIVPFKFNDETLKCCICFNEFHTFKTLIWHMNSHYRNFVCEVCDAGFVIQCNLADHARSHKIGSFTCSFCPQIFDTYVKKKAHEYRLHVRLNLSHKCGYCNQKFKEYRAKEMHVIEMHNGPRTVHKCQACEKTFKHRGVLLVHLKRHHLLERPHKCSHCDMDFFSRKELKDHVVKHTGLREFQCDVCLKSFGRKSTLKTHMRTHASDRRY